MPNMLFDELLLLLNGEVAFVCPNIGADCDGWALLIALPKTEGAAAGCACVLLLVPNPIEGACVFPPKLKADLAGSWGLSPNRPKMLDEAAAGAGAAAVCPKLNPPPSGCGAAGCAGAPKENVESAFGAGFAAAF